MPTKHVSFRVDEVIKEQASVLFAEMGLNMSTAISLFLCATIKHGKIPFEIVGNEYARNDEN
jgi:DNA-damage-inducible protein J